MNVFTPALLFSKLGASGTLSTESVCQQQLTVAGNQSWEATDRGELGKFRWCLKETLFCQNGKQAQGTISPALLFSKLGASGVVWARQPVVTAEYSSCFEL
jgi:hypothetical protein